MSKRYYVISYDISDDKKREMMAKLLERYGVRVQKSVFECYVDEKLIIEIKRKASSIIDMETDSVRFYLLCKRCVETIEFIGKTPSLEEGEIDII
ncbi:MAG: CRISPR-associated endonuclease Cas2 [Clostridia bacterium]|nr:MAG: CRISPR-associated endoribonuclease Cas2 [bacterium 42_11]MBC7332271.1 CRISPR-associated endonuclease Cas2 [Synergistota bacterium]MBC7337252.1 CRISPR-associated endonuclease Cas2 [Clostridia bacterium]MDK2872055.1 CRISPR-associated protein Cas2 [bacterium]